MAAAAEFSKNVTHLDFYKDLNAKMELKGIQPLNFIDLEETKSNEEFKPALKKIEKLLKERGFGFYLAEAVHFDLIIYRFSFGLVLKNARELYNLYLSHKALPNPGDEVDYNQEISDFFVEQRRKNIEILYQYLQ